jgi:porin
MPCLRPWHNILLIAGLFVCTLATSARADTPTPAPGTPTIAPSAAPAPATAPTEAPPPAGATPAAGTSPLPSPTPLAGGGWRTRLHNEGVDLRLDYVSESAVNTTGGKYRGAAYAQQIRFGTDLDLGKLAGVKGAAFHLTLNDRAGGGLSANNFQNKLAVQEIYGAGQNFRLGELSLDQNLAKKKYNVKLGFWAYGNDFGLTLLLCNFMNSGFCGHPQSLPNDSGWSDYPVAKWGVRVKDNTSASTYVETGAFETNPLRGGKAYGFNMSWHGATGVLYPVELAWLPGHKPGMLPGEYKVGAYYDSSHVADIGAPAFTDSGRFGYYVLASQMVVHEPGRPGGLWVFAQGTNSDPQTALIKYYLDAGLVLQGTLPGRDRDTIGLGYVRAAVNPRLIALKSKPGLDLAPGEQVAELSYGIGISPTVIVRPDIQYLMNPGAFTQKPYGNAMIYGLQIKATF